MHKITTTATIQSVPNFSPNLSCSSNEELTVEKDTKIFDFNLNSSPSADSTTNSAKPTAEIFRPFSPEEEPARPVGARGHKRRKKGKAARRLVPPKKVEAKPIFKPSDLPQKENFYTKPIYRAYHDQAIAIPCPKPEVFGKSFKSISSFAKALGTHLDGYCSVHIGTQIEPHFIVYFNDLDNYTKCIEDKLIEFKNMTLSVIKPYNTQDNVADFNIELISQDFTKFELVENEFKNWGNQFGSVVEFDMIEKNKTWYMRIILKEWEAAFFMLFPKKLRLPPKGHFMMYAMDFRKPSSLFHPMPQLSRQEIVASNRVEFPKLYHLKDRVLAMSVD